MEATFQKQRRYSRHKPPKRMLIAWRSAGCRMVSRAEVLGMGGLFLHTASPPELGTIIEVLFDLDPGEVRARAVVRDSAPGKGMGVQFVQMDPDARARLTRFLSQCAPADPSPC
jgi:hypothetical protein